MHILKGLVATLLPIAALAAKKPAADRFQQYHTKALSSTPLKLDDNLYGKLTSAPRDYSAVVLLNAMDPRFGCQLCREFQPEWDLLSKSWIKGDKKGESRLIYGTLDFNDGKNVFQSLGLQTAPVMLLFRPTIGPHAAADTGPIRYDFTNGHTSIRRASARLDYQPFARPTLSKSRTTHQLAWPYVLPIAQNRNLWAAISLIAILLFTSGHMFNHIRKVPYVAGDGKGGISYFAGGFSNQYGLETQIVAGIYGLLSFATISLALKVPRIQDPRAQQVAVLIWGAVIVIMYSFLLSVFRTKSGGYPFWLPPFA
ncbi:hypothetical protein JHW43_005400 [Diplocarpon mali]|nr:hypothetical protein JHW43_005400 [Diplocarpon mali]